MVTRETHAGRLREKQDVHLLNKFKVRCHGNARAIVLLTVGTVDFD